MSKHLSSVRTTLALDFIEEYRALCCRYRCIVTTGYNGSALHFLPSPHHDGGGVKAEVKSHVETLIVNL